MNAEWAVRYPAHQTMVDDMQSTRISRARRSSLLSRRSCKIATARASSRNRIHN